MVYNTSMATDTAGTCEVHNVASTLEGLRSRVDQLTRARRFRMSAFYADKLLAFYRCFDEDGEDIPKELRDNKLADYYRLANSWYLDKQYNRALYFLESYNLIEPSFSLAENDRQFLIGNNGTRHRKTTDGFAGSKHANKGPANSLPDVCYHNPTSYIAFTHLAAQCLFALERWDDVVELIAAIFGHDDDEENDEPCEENSPGFSVRELSGNQRAVLQKHPVLSKLLMWENDRSAHQDSDPAKFVEQQFTKNLPWARICSIVSRGITDPPDTCLSKLCGPYDLMVSLLCLIRAEAHLVAHAKASKTALANNSGSTTSKQEGGVLGISADGTAAKLWAIAAALIDPACVDAVELLTENFLLSSTEESCLGQTLGYLLSDNFSHSSENAASTSDGDESLLMEPPTDKLRTLRQVNTSYQQSSQSSYETLDLTAGEFMGHLYNAMFNKYDLSRNIPTLFRPFEALVVNCKRNTSNHALRTNIDVLTVQAACAFYQHDPAAAATLTRTVLTTDPFHRSILPIHFASLSAVASPGYGHHGGFFSYGASRNISETSLQLDSHRYWNHGQIGNEDDSTDDTPAHETNLALTRLSLNAVNSHSIPSLTARAELFRAAHDAVKTSPSSGISWYGVGCYYMAIGQPTDAAKNFRKATRLDPLCAFAWVGLGHARSAIDESDAALSAYRTASRMFPANHAASLFLGMELARTHHVTMAETMIHSSRQLCSSDPLSYHELGILAYNAKQYEQALDLFKFALNLTDHLSIPQRQCWSVAYANAGHAHRKVGIKCIEKAQDEAKPSMMNHFRQQFRMAHEHFRYSIEYYEQALALGSKSAENKADILLAIALTKLLNGHPDEALEDCISCLSLSNNKSTASDLQTIIMSNCASMETASNIIDTASY